MLQLKLSYGTEKISCLMSRHYLYKVLDYAKHTETGELLVIYEALYDGQSIDCDVHCGDKFARPFNMFMDEVDHIKYPCVKQKYRFEVIS